MALSMDSLLTGILSNRRRAASLKRLGILTVGDALTYYPFRVTPSIPRGTLRQATPGQKTAFLIRVINTRVTSMARGKARVLSLVEDADIDSAGLPTRDSRAPAKETLLRGTTPSARAQLVFFSYKPQYLSWISGRLPAGATAVVCGEPSLYNGSLQLTHPDIQVVGRDCACADEAFQALTVPRPVYHATASLSSERIHETIVDLLRAIQASDNPEAIVPTVVPASVREANHLMGRLEALTAIHTPQSPKQFQDGIRSMRYEEAFLSQMALLEARRAIQNETAFPCAQPTVSDSGLVSQLIEHLPFELTDGQKDVLAHIGQDMTSSRPMHRLLQGEVGSGKTIVALIAMLQAVQAGYQAVLVAPTQVLAEQHYATITRQLKTALGKSAPRVVLLTGALRLHEQCTALATVANGEPCLVVATHTAFSKKFQAPKMALAVIDEQHRFGVKQRDSLLDKSDRTPHLLVMTATPIPRTAAMTWFGDLDFSELQGVPSGRKPVQTFVIPEADARSMARMFVHCRQRINAGERVYIVCPAIETEDDGSNAAGTAVDPNLELFEDHSEQDMSRTDGLAVSPLHSVEEMVERLPRLPQFAGVGFARLTGRDDVTTKARVMRGFIDGKTPVLVATTVIEVGVDVPQASCIVIFNSDRFGLTQLHQLRGRVGRGGTDAWAFLVSNAEPGSLAAQRLEVVRTSSNGADIAQADLELRGVGEVLGDVQAGSKSSFKLLRVVKDAPVILQARDDAARVLDADPELVSNPQLAGAVLDFLRGNEKFLMRS
ncbi:MAG: ATP-dependent DNA helicase RecG [Bifidobacteriaceae bacterium]|nr:ATP-dependent DNA helicase RecG [Bifidobacteriaceae bacterium]